MTELKERVYAATAQTASDGEGASRSDDGLRGLRTAEKFRCRVPGSVQISALVAERWKASVVCARIPTPAAATSMLRSTWSKSNRRF
jgi:hypothetical protein